MILNLIAPDGQSVCLGDMDSVEEANEVTEDFFKTVGPMFGNAMFKYFEFADGKTTNVAYMDGYDFGDRMLEGVPFKVEIVNGQLEVSFANPNGIYEGTIDQAYWLEQAKINAEDQDIFYETANLDGYDLTLV